MKEIIMEDGPTTAELGLSNKDLGIKPPPNLERSVPTNFQEAMDIARAVNERAETETFITQPPVSSFTLEDAQARASQNQPTQVPENLPSNVLPQNTEDIGRLLASLSPEYNANVNPNIERAIISNTDLTPELQNRLEITREQYEGQGFKYIKTERTQFGTFAVFENPNGENTRFNLAQEGFEPKASGEINSPDPNKDKDEFRQWVMNQIELSESPTGLSNLNLKKIMDYVTTIQNYDSTHLGGIEVALKNELSILLQRRLFLAFAEEQASNNNAEGFTEAFSKLGKLKTLEWFAGPIVVGAERHEYARGIAEGIKQIEETNEGNYFRLEGAAKDAERDRILGRIESALIIFPNFGPIAPTELRRRAEVSFKYSEMLLRVYGMETAYLGPRNAAGRLIEFQILDATYGVPVVGAPPPAVDLTRESYWVMWEQTRRAGGFQAEVDPITNRNIPKIGGQILFRRIYNTPEEIERLNAGLAESLRYATDVRVKNFALFMGKRTLTEVINTGEGSDHYRWSAIVKGGSEQADKFYKSKPKLLDSPLDEPNQVQQNHNAGGKAFETIRSEFTFDYLNNYKGVNTARITTEARARLVTNLLEYVNTKEAKNLFNYASWGAVEKSEAIHQLISRGYLRKDQYKVLRDWHQIASFWNLFMGGLGEATGEAGEKFAKLASALARVIDINP